MDRGFEEGSGRGKVPKTQSSTISGVSVEVFSTF